MCAFSKRSSPFPRVTGTACRRALGEGLGLILAASLLAIATAQFHPRRAEVSTARQPGNLITPAAARDLSVGIPALWIDARSSTEFDRGHYPSALRLTEAEWDELLEDVIEAWDPDKTIFVYCGSMDCGASASVAARLSRELGTEDVRIIKGGWEALSP